MTNMEWAIQQTVHSRRGLSKIIADELNTSQQVVLNKANPDNDLNHFHIEQAVTIQKITGDARILKQMADELGFEIVPKKTKATDILSAVLQSDKEHGDIGQAIQEALDDGRISDAEMREVMTQIEEAHESLNTLAASVKRHKEGE